MASVAVQMLRNEITEKIRVCPLNKQGRTQHDRQKVMLLLCYSTFLLFSLLLNLFYEGNLFVYQRGTVLQHWNKLYQSWKEATAKTPLVHIF